MYMNFTEIYMNYWDLYMFSCIFFRYRKSTWKQCIFLIYTCLLKSTLILRKYTSFHVFFCKKHVHFICISNHVHFSKLQNIHVFVLFCTWLTVHFCKIHVHFMNNVHFEKYTCLNMYIFPWTCTFCFSEITDKNTRKHKHVQIWPKNIYIFDS